MTLNDDNRSFSYLYALFFLFSDHEETCVRKQPASGVILFLSSTSVNFGVFSPQEIKKLSVLELHQRDLFDISSQDRKPAIGGALDRRLVINFNQGNS
jgi:hypothetical protein